MEDPLTTQLRTSEMTAASRPSAAGVAHLFQPLEPVVAEPLKTSNTFAMVKSALGLSSLIIAITSLGVLITVFTTKRKGMVSVGLNLQLSLVRLAPAVNPIYFYTLSCFGRRKLEVINVNRLEHQSYGIWLSLPLSPAAEIGARSTKARIWACI